MGHTPSTAGTFRKKFRKNSGKTPETLSERFLEFPSRVRLGCPKPYNSKHFEAPRAFPEFSPPQYGWGRFFFQKWFRRGPLRASHGVASSTGGISDLRVLHWNSQSTCSARKWKFGTQFSSPKCTTAPQLQSLAILGACAMTTKILDNKISTFKILLSWRFPRKQAFLGRFSSLPPRPPTLKSEHFIFIVVLPSQRCFESQTKSQGICAVRSRFGHFSSQNAWQPQPYRYRREIANYSPESIAAYRLTA